MRGNPVKRNAEASAEINLAALETLAKISDEYVLREHLIAANALRAQALRYETAIDIISHGVSFFDSEQRLILSNRRYAEIYHLQPEEIRPGTTLRDIAERRFTIGTCPMAAADYLVWCAAINAGTVPKTWTSELKDGRKISICHHPMPDGGWIATHEDITGLGERHNLVNERISLQALIDWVPDYLWIKDLDSRFVVVNKALSSDSGRASPSDMIGTNDFDLHASELAQKFFASEQDILLSGQPMIGREEFVVDGSGAGRWLSSTKVPLYNERNEIFGLVGIARDITERKKADILRNGQAQILEMIAMSAPLEDVLKHLVLLVEAELTGIFATVLLLDKDGVHLRHGAAPSLPEAYNTAIDGVRIGPKVGSCGTAIYRREAVIVTDIEHDPLWEDYRELALAHGYRSCWSTPILSHQGPVLGTFAMYSTTVRSPTAAETSLVNVFARMAGIAIERKQAS